MLRKVTDAPRHFLLQGSHWGGSILACKKCGWRVRQIILICTVWSGSQLMCTNSAMLTFSIQRLQTTKFSINPNRLPPTLHPTNTHTFNHLLHFLILPLQLLLQHFFPPLPKRLEVSCQLLHLWTLRFLWRFRQWRQVRVLIHYHAAGANSKELWVIRLDGQLAQLTCWLLVCVELHCLTAGGRCLEEWSFFWLLVWRCLCKAVEEACNVGCEQAAWNKYIHHSSSEGTVTQQRPTDSYNTTLLPSDKCTRNLLRCQAHSYTRSHQSHTHTHTHKL